MTLVNKLYRFQVYNPIVHHLYGVLCVHHPNSSLLPSLSPLYPLSPPPALLSLWQSPRCCLCLQVFFFLNPFTIFAQPCKPTKPHFNRTSSEGSHGLYGVKHLVVCEEIKRRWCLNSGNHLVRQISMFLDSFRAIRYNNILWFSKKKRIYLEGKDMLNLSKVKPLVGLKYLLIS